MYLADESMAVIALLGTACNALNHIFQEVGHPYRFMSRQQPSRLPSDSEVCKYYFEHVCTCGKGVTRSRFLSVCMQVLEQADEAAKNLAEGKQESDSKPEKLTHRDAPDICLYDKEGSDRGEELTMEVKTR